MSRAAATDTVVVKPSNNVYTALAIVGALFVITGAVLVILKAGQVFGPKFGLFD
jgi:hypothetical protein